METLPTTLLVLSILFLATFIRSTLGFGDALLAMPLLALLVGIRTATPLVAFGGSTIALTILVGNWRQVDLRVTWRLILSTLVGIPVGLWILRFAPENWILGGLGLLLVLFGVYNLVKPGLRPIAWEPVAFLFGFFAGILGGAYNTNGPPIVVYGALRGWSAERFRTTLQSYFFPTGLLILAGHGLAGLWTPAVLSLYLMALPLILLGLFLGGKVNRRLSPGRFQHLVSAAVVVFGLLLVFQSGLLRG